MTEVNPGTDQDVELTEEPKLITTEVVASYSGKISTGRYENESPFFSLKEVWTGDINVDERQRELSEKCYRKFSECEQRSIIARIMAERKDLRFYPQEDGKSYPSITSILGWDKDFFISTQELLQYGARGTLIHRLIEIYAKLKVWKEAKDLLPYHREYVVVTKGSLSLSLDGYRIDKFWEDYGLETSETESVSVNPEHGYAGRKDWKGLAYTEKKTAKNDPSKKLTMIDWKTSAKLDKKYVLCQLAAHVFCPGNEDVEQVIAVPVNNTTAQGYTAPIVMAREDLKPYFDLFLKQKENFNYRFGL